MQGEPWGQAGWVGEGAGDRGSTQHDDVECNEYNNWARREGGREGEWTPLQLDMDEGGGDTLTTVRAHA